MLHCCLIRGGLNAILPFFAPMKAATRKKLDQVFSHWTRLRYTDLNGEVGCISCGKRAHWKEMHAGHFITRAKYATRWNEKNVMPQCPRCNLYLQGAQWEFGHALNDKFGGNTTDELIRLSNQTLKMGEPEAQDLIKYYQQQIKDFIPF